MISKNFLLGINKNNIKEMTDPAKNTFQNQSALYLNLTVPEAGRLATTNTDLIIGYQGPQYPGGTSRGVEIRADTPDLVYMDIHANDGATGENFDYRMIWGAGGATGEGQGVMNVQGAGTNFYMPLRTNPTGAALPPAWFLDYGDQVATAGTNQLTTITFNTTFQSAPKVILQVVDSGSPGVQVDNFTTYIEATTTTTCTVRGFGVVNGGFTYNWLAIGGV
jgi:hypothetical protein